MDGRHAGLALILATRGEAEGMESRRIRERVGGVAAALHPYASEPSVADLLDRVDADAVLPGDA